MTVINASHWQKPVSIAPLVTFRILFGMLMFVATIRFVWMGWVDSLFILPKFHFTYWGFEWVQPLSPSAMYFIYFLLAASSLSVALGFCYPLAAILFFLCFTYTELIDIATYLNHYYFVSLISFLMIWLPANQFFSLDLFFNWAPKKERVPAWTIEILQFQIGVVYFFAGLAKLNSDWLMLAQPMKIWLPAKSHLPIIGHLFYQKSVPYLFAWFGTIYDLLIPFFLKYPPTTFLAYLFVLIFHAATALVFPSIGLFPYIMMVCSLIFFSGEFHEKILSASKAGVFNHQANDVPSFSLPTISKCFLTLYVTLQSLMPLRYLCYPDNVFWTEQGFRFSWRVMLIEKAGIAFFSVRDGKKTVLANNAEFLTPLQEKMMSTQPDMLLQFSHFLAEEYSKRGMKQPRVYAEVYVTLNGRPSRLFLDSSVDLAHQQFSMKHFDWILPSQNQ